MTIPLEISNHHVHLTAEHFTALFGPTAELHELRPISQPGQFAAVETVTVVGPHGQFERVRIVGPFRPYSQIELSPSDAHGLGIEAPLRSSGQLSGAAPIRLVGPVGQLDLPAAAIIQQRHIHATPDDCRRFGLVPGSQVRVQTHGPNAVVFEHVYVKVDPASRWRCHLNLDEANAASVRPGDAGEILA